MKRGRIIAIVGPTASGKSEFAVKLAKKIGGEIISADSRQVYKYLDIGSAKVPGKWENMPRPHAFRNHGSRAPAARARYLSSRGSAVQFDNGGTKPAGLREFPQNMRAGQDIKKIFIYKGIPHHCIDFVNPKRRFTVAEWKKCAEKAIKDIQNRGKIPIICGGTGFYVDAVILDSKFPEVPPDKKLRKKLERLSPARLFARLKKLDPRRAKIIDQNNKRRLIRALEIVIKTGKPVPIPIVSSKRTRVHPLVIKLNPPPNELKKRIERRLMARFKHGLIEEVRNLHKKHKLSWRRLDELGLEYRYVSRYLRGFITYDEMVGKINSESWRYAKRQIKWFKKYKD